MTAPSREEEASLSVEEDFLAFQAEGGARVEDEDEAAAAAAMVAGLGAFEGASTSPCFTEGGTAVSSRVALGLRSKLKRGSRRSFLAAS